MTSVLNSLWQTITLSSEKASTNTSEVAGRDDVDTDKEDSQSTPKAGPQILAPDVPSFELSEHTEGGECGGIDLSELTEGGVSEGITSSSQQMSSPTQLVASPKSIQTSPRQPAPSGSSLAPSATPGSSLPPSAPPRTSLSPSAPPRSSLAPAGLMPPPGRPSGPLPNRGPPGNSQQRVGSNARGKVLLSPGHSPMDWATLTRSSNLSGVPSFQRVTPSQLKTMNGRKGKPIWSSYQGKVYNITPYLPFHPGGEKELFKSAGRDGTKLFMDIHPWVNWEGMLSACLVGILVSEDAEGTLEDID